MKKYIVLLIWIGFFAPSAFSQLKMLDTASYNQWRSIAIPNLSYTGEWVLYSYQNEAQGLKYLRNTKTQREVVLKDISSAEFFNRGQWLKYSAKGKGQDSTFLMRLSDGKKIYWTKAPYFTVSKTSGVVVYTKRVNNVNQLVMLNIEKGDSLTIDRIGKYKLLNENGAIVYIRDQELLYRSLKTAKPRLIYAGDVTDFSFNEGDQTGRFLSGQKIFSFSTSVPRYAEVLDFSTITAPAGYRLVPRLYEVSIATKQLEMELLPLAEKANVAVTGKENMLVRKKPAFDLELWTWNEFPSRRLQRRGRSASDPDPKFIYNFDEKKWTSVLPVKSGFVYVPSAEKYDYLLSTDPVPYQKMVDWRYGNNSDIYAVDVRSGKRKLILKDAYTLPEWSPNGKYGVIYNSQEKEWQVFDPVKVEFAGFSSQLAYPVYDESHDKPNPAASYGLAGWVDGTSIAVYDRYDIWVIDLSGHRKAYALTQGFGRRNQISLRLQGASFKANLDLSKSLLLQSFNEKTKSQGIYRLSSGKLEKLADYPDYSVKILAKSDDGKAFLFTKESYRIFPDIWLGNENLARQQQLTQANPQQKNFGWGRAKVVEWKNFEGRQNQGLLYLPEDYDPKKTYPVIVDFYETHSEHLNEYQTPLYSTCTINIPTYVSKGYIVFRPDVLFTVGKPAESAYSSVVSGTEALIAGGVADRNHIGLQGHSYSGYLVAYLATRSNLFRCINIGAGVVNITSNYTALRGNGAPNLFKYEVEQGRMGKSLWEDTSGYISNSAIFKADKIQSPLLILHNDNDGAVPFSQGLDLFLAMRRLQKPAWLLNYKGEGHTLDGLAAQQDWTERMEQFFDHYLKDRAMPAWMLDGLN
jgi:dipeptidyl aminopeptidase/acylaminoacyl peptidase